MENRKLYAGLGAVLLTVLAASGIFLAGCSGKKETADVITLFEAADDMLSHADRIKAQGSLESKSIRSGEGREVPCSLAVDYTTAAESAGRIVRIQSDISAGYLDVSWNGTTDAYYLKGEDGDTMYLYQYVSGREKDAEWKKGKTSVKSADLAEALNPFSAMDPEEFRILDSDSDENQDSYDLTAAGKADGETVKNLLLYGVSSSDPLRDYDYSNMEFTVTAEFHAEKEGSFGRMTYTPLSLNLKLDKKTQDDEGNVLNTLVCKIKYTDLTSEEDVKIPDEAKKGNTSTELDKSGGTVFFEKLAETGETPEGPEQENSASEQDSAGETDNASDADNGPESQNSGTEENQGDGTSSGRSGAATSPGVEGETANDYKMSTFMEFTLSGLDIKLGETKLTDLLDAGLTLDHDDSSVRLDSEKLHRIYFEIGEDYLEADLKNETSNAQPLAECTVVGFKVHFYDYTAKVKYSNALSESDYYGTYKLFLGAPTYELVNGNLDECTWYDASGLYHLEAYFSTENYQPEYLYMYLDAALQEDEDASGGGNG
ncbi:MAG: hypothetical protein U0L49_01560 [Eubacterium sp.]|nr:hypothetical protein [Eubacterium sp.]